jgi:hypothetical protein
MLTDCVVMIGVRMLRVLRIIRMARLLRASKHIVRAKVNVTARMAVHYGGDDGKSEM